MPSLPQSIRSRAGPDGHAPKSVALAFTAMFASAPGQSFVIAVFLDAILADTGLSRTAFSALYAAATVVSASAMIAVGRSADRFGLRTIWLVVCAGLALACGAAGLLVGVATAFVALSLLRTFGQGSFPLVGTLLVAHAFGARRGRAMAVATFGITVASMVLPPGLVLVIESLGWRETYYLLAAGVLALAPLALLIPAGAAQRPRGEDEPAPSEEAFPPALRRSRRLPRLEVPTRRAAQLLFVLAVPPLVMTAIIFHGVSVLGQRGLSLREAGVALGFLGLASALGTIGAGAVADRTPTRALLAAMSALLTAAAALLLLPSAPAAYVAFAALGFAGGVFGVASGILWARTYGLRRLGRIQGTSFSVQIAAAAAGPLPLAASLSLAGGYEPALIALAAFAAAGLVASLAWREPA